MNTRQEIEQSIKEIKVKIEQHERLLLDLEGGVNQENQDLGSASRIHGRGLKVILLEAIEVLENSRKAFKSKELETLRKKLIRVLAEDTQL